MTNTNYEQFHKLIERIRDFNDVAITVIDQANISDTNCLSTVLRHNRNLIDDLTDLIEEELKEKEAE